MQVRDTCNNFFFFFDEWDAYNTYIKFKQDQAERMEIKTIRNDYWQNKWLV